jgi:hypothetical protein
MNTLNQVRDFITQELNELNNLNGAKQLTRKSLIQTFQKSIEELPKEHLDSILGVFLKGLQFEERLNSGLGKNRLTYKDVQSLFSKYNYLIDSYGDGNPNHVKNFVTESRPIQISENFIISSFELLPKEMKDSLTGKGGVGDVGKKHQFLGYTTESGRITSDRTDEYITGIHRGSAGNKDRGRFVWRVILEQGGIDPYTGNKLDLNSIDLEHVVAFDNSDNGQPTMDDYMAREHDDNIIICNTNVNQMKNNLSMKDFLDQRVLPETTKTKEEFEMIDELYEIANNFSDITKQKATELVEQLENKTISAESLLSIFEEWDSKVKTIKDNARKVIENPRDRSKITSLKSELGKNIIQSMGLSRGLTHHSGRRTVKLTSDNIYRGYIVSMVENFENNSNYKSEWEQARLVGNEYAKTMGSNGQPAMLEYILKNKLISNRVLQDKKMSKVWN